MESIHINPQRRAELEEYARRRGQDAEAALDEALATYLEWERQDFAQAAEGIRRGSDDVQAGRSDLVPKFLLICGGSMTFRDEK